MRARLVQLFAIVGVTTVVVLAANTVALAATGRGFLLGQTNQSAKLTTLERVSAGPALRLETKSDDAPPFTTNATGRVRNLDADTVDGLDSTELRNAATLRGLTPSDLRPSRLVTRYDSEFATRDDFVVGIDLRPFRDTVVTYQAGLLNASASSYCEFEQPNRKTGYTRVWGRATGAGQTPSPSSPTLILTASTVLAINDDEMLDLHCHSDTPFTLAFDAIAVS